MIVKLALTEQLHGQGLGEQLLLDALSRCVVAGEVVGSRFVVVDAIDAAAESFYVRYGFQSLPTPPQPDCSDDSLRSPPTFTGRETRSPGQ